MSPLHAASASTVRAAVDKYWVREERPERLLILGARPDWDGPDVIEVGLVNVRVVTAISTLQVRDHLSTLRNERLLVLTDVREDEIGRDVLSRAVRQAVVGVGSWEMLLLAFRLGPAAPIDSNLVRDGEDLARAIVDGAPASGWPPPSSGILTRDHVFRSIAHERLGLEPDRLDGAGILAWTLNPTGVLALRDQPKAIRGLLGDWIEAQGGLGTRPAVQLAVRGDGTDALPLGVLAGLLWGTGGTGRAQGRFESILGRRPVEAEVKEWSALAESWLSRRLDTNRSRVEQVLRRAEDIAREHEFLDDLGDSHWMPASLEKRVRVVAVAAEDSVKTQSVARRSALEQALSKVLRHRLAQADLGDVPAVLMAARLARWLATSPGVHDHLAAALVWQINEGGWVDRARQVLANGVADAEAGRGLAAVHERASDVRAAIDERAADRLAIAVSSDQDPGSLVPVENALQDLRPLAEQRAVLFVVVDGMSAAVASEVAESVTAAGWSEQVPHGVEGRKGVLAGLPTVTEVSRASLLTGERKRGGQSVERAGLSRVMGEDAALFHKGDLLGAACDDLPVDVRHALQDTAVRTVAVVLNSVDDALSKGEPGRTRWGVDSIAHLRALLERAGAAGRVVVLTSDHGHVVDREPGELRRDDAGGGRWRRADGQLGAGEIELKGPRVQLGDGAVVAAVSEGLRYRPRASGYHGGAALAELAIPWMVFVRRGDELEGHVPLENAAPTWWNQATETWTDESPAENALF